MLDWLFGPKKLYKIHFSLKKKKSGQKLKGSCFWKGSGINQDDIENYVEDEAGETICNFKITKVQLINKQ
jgi:hypothetical protein